MLSAAYHGTNLFPVCNFGWSRTVLFHADGDSLKLVVLGFDLGVEDLDALALLLDQDLELITLLRDLGVHGLNVLLELTEAGPCRWCRPSPELASRRVNYDIEWLSKRLIAINARNINFACCPFGSNSGGIFFPSARHSVE